MPELLRGKSDPAVKQIKDVLSQYEAEHAGAKAALYRRNSASVRIRIIDPSFSGRSIGERSEQAWLYLRKLPEAVRDDISVLLLLPPEEAATSFANVEFENPLPSRL